MAGGAAGFGRRRRGDGARGARPADERRVRRRGRRLGAGNVLVQELPAVEGWRSVDILCLDKTGTLTEGSIVCVVETIGRLRGRAWTRSARSLPRIPSPNATALALSRAFVAQPGWHGHERDPVLVGPQVERGCVQRAGVVVPRRSRRSSFPLREHAGDVMAKVQERVEEQAKAGRARGAPRTVRQRALNGDSPPADLTPRALVLLEDKIRPTPLRRWRTSPRRA